jgi:hypothetical protein
MNDRSAKEPTKRGTTDYGHDWPGDVATDFWIRTDEKSQLMVLPHSRARGVCFLVIYCCFILFAGWAEAWLFFMWRRRDTPSSDTLTWLWLHFLFIFFLLLIARTSQRLLSQRTNETNEKKVDNDIIETSLSPCWLMLYR